MSRSETRASLTPLDDARAQSAAWCAELLAALAEREVTQAELIAFFGADAGVARGRADDRWRAVTPRSRVFSQVLVGHLSHVSIPVRVEADLAEPLSFAALEAALGAPSRVPPNPHPTSRQTFAVHRQGSYGYARIFVEVERAAPTQIVRVELDVTPR